MKDKTETTPDGPPNLQHHFPKCEVVWDGCTTTQSLTKTESRILKNALSSLLNLVDTSRRGSHLGARVATFLKLDQISEKAT